MTWFACELWSCFWEECLCGDTSSHTSTSPQVQKHIVKWADFICSMLSEFHKPEIMRCVTPHAMDGIGIIYTLMAVNLCWISIANVQLPWLLFSYHSCHKLPWLLLPWFLLCYHSNCLDSHSVPESGVQFMQLRFCYHGYFSVVLSDGCLVQIFSILVPFKDESHPHYHHSRCSAATMATAQLPYR